VPDIHPAAAWYSSVLGFVALAPLVLPSADGHAGRIAAAIYGERFRPPQPAVARRRGHARRSSRPRDRHRRHRVFSAFRSSENLCEWVAKGRPEPLGVFPMFESHHQVVREPHGGAALMPEGRQ
jgi:hypothetical protein